MKKERRIDLAISGVCMGGMIAEPLKSFGQGVGGYIEVAMVRGLERYTTSKDSRD